MRYTYACKTCGKVEHYEDYGEGLKQSKLPHIDESVVDSLDSVCSGEFVRVYKAPAIVFKGSGFTTNTK